MGTINDEGWVCLWRKSKRSQVFQNEGLWKVWTWCLMKANYEDAWVPMKTGRGETQVFVKRGQFIFGRESASKELKMRPSTVQDRIKKLANMRNLVTQPVTHYSIITVCNYEEYQNHVNSIPSVNPSTIRQPSVTKNNLNKGNKDIGRSKKKETDPRVKEFEDYWGKAFQEQTGQPYVFAFGKDGSLIKQLLAVHDLSILEDVTKAFFKDEQCKRRGLTVGILFQEINRLLSLKAMNPLEQARREMAQRG